MTAPSSRNEMASGTRKPLALVVFLENVGHIHGLNLPHWVMQTIDFVTEEYAKVILRLYGAYRRYDQVLILEDTRATGHELTEALLTASRQHRVDLLLLVHGRPGSLVGFRDQVSVGASTFKPLIQAYQDDPSLLDLRMVYGLNCFGASLAPVWLALGADAVNGSAGVNWLPEPSLSLFLRDWLQGVRFSEAVIRSNHVACAVGSRVWRPTEGGNEHPNITSSRQAIFGVCDVTVDG
ncbi:MAG: hypothetical protein HC802_11270 [Caldilineaceae bacterium]|nr:hypothetical protein [Caldilineaceae bacterium]